MKSPRRTTMLRALATWLALGLFLTALFLLVDLLAGSTNRLPGIFIAGLTCATLWLTMALPIWRLASHRVLAEPMRPRAFVLHSAIALSAALLFTSLYTVVMFGAWRLRGVEDYPWDRQFRGAVSYFFVSTILYYWIVVVARRAFDLALLLGARELAASKAERELARAHLDILRMQVRPHFLFNTLNTVSALIRAGDPEPAQRMLSRLSDFLRSSLFADDEQVAPLSVELSNVAHYVEIERSRFGERLQFTTDVDPALADHPVPRWTLQPLVENAVLHGLEADPTAGRIHLSARREGARFHLTIEDDGPGADCDAEEGIGLGNTRLRLQALYGDGAELSVRARTDGGTTVEITTPLDTEACLS